MSNTTTFRVRAGNMNGDGGSGQLHVQVPVNGHLQFLYNALKLPDTPVRTLNATPYGAITGDKPSIVGLITDYSLSVNDGTVLVVKGQSRSGMRKVKQGMLALCSGRHYALVQITMKLPKVPRLRVDTLLIEGRFRFMRYEELQAHNADPGRHLIDWFDESIYSELFTITELAPPEQRERIVRVVKQLKGSDGRVVSAVNATRVRKMGRRVL